MSDHKNIIDVNIPEGDMVVGYVAQFKVLASDGTYYWASRKQDVNDAEAVGMLTVQLDDYRDDFRNFPKTIVSRDD